jgi:hypothetical protein
VPERLRHLSRDLLPPLRQRPSWVGFRGRHLGHCWGDLAFFKVEIGSRFKYACERHGIPCDIAWTEEARIYQDKWFPFIASCRAMLGTPSGCNVFDWDGRLEREYRQLIARDPDLSYHEYRPTIAHKEAEIDMGQASPRIFETVALGTVLILLEGSYSNVIRPGEDCIMVKRDFSNVDEVIEQLSDVGHLEAIADKAYANLIASDAWSYRAFVEKVDNEIDRISSDQGCGLDTAGFAPAKAYDQHLLEQMALQSPVQYPLTRWLDLSHLRRAQTDQDWSFPILSAPRSPAMRNEMRLPSAKKPERRSLVQQLKSNLRRLT